MPSFENDSITPAGEALMASLMKQVHDHLPGQVGSLLQKELESLNSLRRELVAITASRDEARAELTQSRAEVSRLKVQLDQHAALSKRMEEVVAKETKAELRDLEVKLLNQRHSEMLGLVNSVFRSPVFTRTVSGQVPVPIEGYNGGCGFVSQGNINTVETTTQARAGTQRSRKPRVLGESNSV